MDWFPFVSLLLLMYDTPGHREIGPLLQWAVGYREGKDYGHIWRHVGVTPSKHTCTLFPLLVQPHLSHGTDP
ncbi:unnamed protein product [Calypogeia fissa]